jgi:uncharacterized protein YegP (UPF0339 family)
MSMALREPQYELYPVRMRSTGKKQWRFRHRSANGKVVAWGERYVRRADAVNAIHVMRNSYDAPIVETKR